MQRGFNAHLFICEDIVELEGLEGIHTIEIEDSCIMGDLTPLASAEHVIIANYIDSDIHHDHYLTLVDFSPLANIKSLELYQCPFIGSGSNLSALQNLSRVRIVGCPHIRREDVADLTNVEFVRSGVEWFSFENLREVFAEYSSKDSVVFLHLWKAQMEAFEDCNAQRNSYLWIEMLKTLIHYHHLTLPEDLLRALRAKLVEFKQELYPHYIEEEKELTAKLNSLRPDWFSPPTDETPIGEISSA
jgi:hypothetical protein